MKQVICDNITLRESVSQQLQKIFVLDDKAIEMFLSQLHNTTQRQIIAVLTKKKSLFNLYN